MNKSLAEDTIIGSIFLNNADDDDVDYFLETIKPEHLSKKRYEEFYKIVKDLRSRNVKVNMDSIKLYLTDGIGEYTGLPVVVTSNQFKEAVNVLRVSSIDSEMRSIMNQEHEKLKEMDILTDADLEFARNSIITKLSELQITGNVKTLKLGDNVEDYLEYLEDLKEGELQAGLMTGYDKIDSVSNGFKPNQLIIVGALESVGKEQPLYSKVLTPNGWKTMGELNTGDYIMGDDGLNAKITGIYPQGIKDVYRVYFDDNTYADCGLEHLWRVQDYDIRNNPKLRNTYKVLPLKEIMNNLNGGYRDRRNYTIPYVKPIQYSTKNYSVDPYFMGIYLGDGYSTGNTVAISNVENDIINYIKLYTSSFGYSVRTSCGKDHFITNNRKVNHIATEIKRLDLCGKKSYDKFIPKEYLHGDVNQRIKLLQGLMDTDGYVCQKGGSTLEFSTTSLQLKEDIIELVKSLGGRATFKSRMGCYLKNGIRTYTRLNYRIYISFSNGIIPVSSKKHLEKFKYTTNNKRGKFITKVEKIGQYECQCIMVDNKNHCYITDGYNITHNTTVILNWIVNMMKQKKKVLLFSLEMSKRQLTDRLVSIISGVPLVRLKDRNKFTTDEASKIGNAVKFIQEADLFINTDFDITTDKMMAYAMKIKKSEGLDAVFIDHIHLLGDNEQKGKDLREKMGYISRNLKRLTKNADIPVIALAQLNRDSSDTHSRNMPSRKRLRESGNIEADADIVLIAHRLMTKANGEPEELNEQSRYILFFDKHRDGARAMIDLYLDLNTLKIYNSRSDFEKSFTQEYNSIISID